MTKKEDTIQMSVGGLTLDPVTKTPIVILKDTENKLNLPIWIGLLEATAMATEIEGIKMARPMTHDLAQNDSWRSRLLGGIGGDHRAQGKYLLRLGQSDVGGRQVMIDSRPSDAIALALRTKSPIYVAKAVLEASSMLQQNEEATNVRWKTFPMFPKKNGPRSSKKWARTISSTNNSHFPLRCCSVATAVELALNRALNSPV